MHVQPLLLAALLLRNKSTGMIFMDSAMAGLKSMRAKIDVYKRQVEISVTGQEFMFVRRSASNSQRRFYRRRTTVIKLDSREIAWEYFA